MEKEQIEEKINELIKNGKFNKIAYPILELGKLDSEENFKIVKGNVLQFKIEENNFDYENWMILPIENGVIIEYWDYWNGNNFHCYYIFDGEWKNLNLGC